MKKIYLANGLFGAGDRMINEKIYQEIKKLNIKDLDIYVPQHNEEINDKSKFSSSTDISKADSDELLESDILIAVLDGVEIDSGVAAEVGLFSSLSKTIIGLCTDIRAQKIEEPNSKETLEKLSIITKDPMENQFLYRNLFVVGLIKQNGKIVGSIEELTKEIKMNLF